MSPRAWAYSTLFAFLLWMLIGLAVVTVVMAT